MSMSLFCAVEYNHINLFQSDSLSLANALQGCRDAAWDQVSGCQSIRDRHTEAAKLPWESLSSGKKWKISFFKAIFETILNFRLL